MFGVVTTTVMAQALLMAAVVAQTWDYVNNGADWVEMGECGGIN